MLSACIGVAVALLLLPMVSALETPGCNRALLAFETMLSIITDCEQQQYPNFTALCIAYAKVPQAPPIGTKDLIPTLTGPYAGFATMSVDTSFAGGMVQSLLTGGIMSQSGDLGETMYVLYGINQAYNATNASDVTEQSIVGPWEDGFYGLGDRLAAEAANTSLGWDSLSRTSAYLRASIAYFTGQWLFPTRLSSLEAMRKAEAAFQMAMEAGWSDVLITLNAPYVSNGVTYQLPVIFMTPRHASRKPLKLILGTAGLDFPKEPMWSWYAPGALARGYAVAFFDGPGQGQVLNQDNLPFTPQWEKVVGAVLDALHADPRTAKRINFKSVAHIGYSTGGWLSASACKGLDRRLKACVLSPALLDLSAVFVDPVANYMYGALNYIAQNTPQLLPGNSSALFLNSPRSLFQPLAGECSAESGAPEMISGYLGSALDPLANPDILYLIYAFTGFRANTSLGMLDGAWQGFKTILAFNGTLTHGSNVPTLLFSGTEDSLEGGQESEYLNSMTPSARSKSKLVILDAASGGAQHCQNGGMLAQEAHLYAWLKTVM